MTHALHDHTHAPYGCHCNVVREYHRRNVDTQHKQTICHLKCITYYVVVLMFEVRLYKFTTLNKNIIIYYNIIKQYIIFFFGIHTLPIRTYFPIIAYAIAYVIPIKCMTLSCIHLAMQTSRHSLNTVELPSRCVCFNSRSNIITSF